MKIAFFTDTYFPQINGVTYTISMWKRELERLGHEVFVYFPRDDSYSPGKNEVPLKSLPFVFYKGYGIGLPSFKIVEKGLDIVHVQTPATVGLLGMAVARKQNVPLIVTYHTPAEHYFREIFRSNQEIVHDALRVMYYKYEKNILKRCNLVTSPSREVIELLMERHGSMIHHGVFFYNGIDLGFFREAKTGRFKKDYNIPEGKVIGYAGRHTTEKHLEDIIKLADSFDGTVIIGGEGPSTKEYKEMARGKKNIKFLGFLPRDRLCEFYSCLDLLVFPSTAETEGLVVLEANACGTPAVGANAMALKETITDGLNGYHYYPGDTKDLGKKVEKAYESMEKLKRGAKKRARERSVEKTVEKLASIYEGLRGQGVYRR